MLMTLLLAYWIYQNRNVLAARPSFSSVEVGDPSDDLNLIQNPIKANISDVNNFDGLPIRYNREAISRSECTTENSIVKGPSFPAPDLASVSYSSNGKSFNATLWLTRPIDKPYITESNDSQVLMDIYVLRNQNKTLPKFIKDHIKVTSQNVKDFSLLSNQSTTLGGNAGQEIAYTYTGKKSDPCKHCKDLDILTIRDDKLYILSYYGDVDKYSKYLPTLRYLIKSIEIGQDSSRSVIYGTNGFLTYENDNYRIKMQYPSNWTKDESNHLRDPYSNIVTFYSAKEDASDPYIEQVRVLIHNSHKIRIKLNEYLSETIDSIKGLPGYNLIESKTNNNTIPGSKATYTLVYTYNADHTTYKVREIGMMLGDDRIFKIQYFADALKYSNYLPVVQKIVDTFESNIPILKYENTKSGIKLLYPYNWGKAVEIPQLVPFGYNTSDYFSSVRLLPPLQGMYYLLKNYRMAIGYDSPYGEHRQFLPYTIIIQPGFKNDTWTKTIQQWSFDGKQARILNTENNFQHFSENGKAFVLLNLDLDSLNLPNQFYVYFRSYVDFLNSGQHCILTDDTDFVAIPPPQYTVSAFPTSLTDIRPGDERDIQVRVRSFTTLPFQVLLSTEEQKGLEITFRPNKTSGIPGELTTSDLHIKVLPNATALSYTVPLHADILLMPTFNPTNSTSASIKSISNFTLTVIPPLTIQEHLANFVKDWFNPLTGIVTTLSAIGSGIIGWRFGIRQKNKG
jgi:hypothetical protein